MALSFSKWKNIFPISNGTSSSSSNSNSSRSISDSAAVADDGRNNNVDAIRKFKMSRKGLSGADKLEAEVGFKLILDPIGSTQTTTSSIGPFESKQNVTVPELNINIVGARHLPSSFGLKSVEGYMIKVKLFPGTVRHDTSIQTNSWPKFNETFKFPLAPALKSSIRSRSKNDLLSRSLPERLFKGHFVVLTVFALLELPPGTLNPFKETYQSFKRKGSLMLKEKRIISNSKANEKDEKKEADEKEKANVSVINLTPSESRRNLGSVTCFLDPKIFVENPKTGHFCTEEFWLPVKDITATPASKTNSNGTQFAAQNTKGQIEVTLHICDATEVIDETPENGNAAIKSSDVGKKSKPSKKLSDKRASAKKTDPTNPFDDDDNGGGGSGANDEVVERDHKPVDIFTLNSADYNADDQQQQQQQKVRHSFDTNRNLDDDANDKPVKPRSWSFGDMKKKIARIKIKDKPKGKCLKIVINRMRCSIRVKEDFENMAGEEIYLKMTIFERDILSETWKSKPFAPTLSYRWEASDSTTMIPLVNDYDVDYMSIKISVATKTKVGKKIVLGTLQLGPGGTGEKLDHWNEMTSSRGSPIVKWHNFE